MGGWHLPFTLYEWFELPDCIQACQEALERAIGYLAQEPHNQMLLLSAQVNTDDQTIPIALSWVGDMTDLREWFDAHAGEAMMIGRIPSVWEGEIVRGYAPDANGIVQSGAY